MPSMPRGGTASQAGNKGGTPKENPGQGTGDSRTVTLRGGGTLTLTVSASFLSLSADDRALLFDLIDRLTAYEKGDRGAPNGSA